MNTNSGKFLNAIVSKASNSNVQIAVIICYNFIFALHTLYFGEHQIKVSNFFIVNFIIIIIYDIV